MEDRLILLFNSKFKNKKISSRDKIKAYSYIK